MNTRWIDRIIYGGAARQILVLAAITVSFILLCSVLVCMCSNNQMMTQEAVEAGESQKNEEHPFAIAMWDVYNHFADPGNQANVNHADRPWAIFISLLGSIVLSGLLISLAAFLQGGSCVIGGTGLYFESLFYPLSFGSAMKDPQLRKKLEDELARTGAEAMHRKLAAADPSAAARLHPNDTKRVIRALEISLSGAAVNGAETGTEVPDVIALKFEPRDRAALYARINGRVEEMMKAGLKDEIARISPDPEWQSMQAIGYKEFMVYSARIRDGKLPLTDEELAATAELIKKHTRNYAKRQLTWFRRYAFAASFDVGDFDAAEEYVAKRLAESGRRNVARTD